MKFFLFAVITCCSFLQLNAQRSCATHAYWQTQLNNDPALRLRYNEIEQSAKTRPLISKKEQGTGVAEMPVITIPVVVHILYNTPGENISDARVHSQLGILNKDFRKQNDDTAFIPSAFAPFAADCGIQFELAKTDPEGRPTSGIVRKKTDRSSWQQDDKMKFSASGGNDTWDSRYYLNIWVCNLTKSLLGYATFPGASPEKDGVVIRTDIFGISPDNATAYNKGRTTTHEVGHWLNLKHLWGDTDCGDDGVEDTPPQKTYNSGCPSFPRIMANSCNPLPSGDMFMNFMDFSDDACLHMFTTGQKQRMQSLFETFAPRESLLHSMGLKEPWNTATPPEHLQDSSSLHVNLFPNPASTSLTLRVNKKELTMPATYHIYDAMGRSVLEGNYTAGRIIQVHTLRTGIYLIQLQWGGQTLTAKFVKQ
ncbi:MAG: M43 family zinc metalloprotease [Chitinophagaceae bacterium]|nr:M43 family zinc metalloprotease [Chitinophagaceae bacterium]